MVNKGLPQEIKSLAGIFGTRHTIGEYAIKSLTASHSGSFDHDVNGPELKD